MSAGDDDGFVIPPPPPGIPQQPVGREEPESEPVDPADMISLPPGLVDSGTYRVSPPRVLKEPAPEVDAPPAFFPVGAPGLSPAAPVEEPATAPAVEASVISAEAPALSAVDDATRVSAGRTAPTTWRLTLPGGQQLVLDQTTLVGRDPAHSAVWPQALLLPLADTSKTVSKTHAAIELTATGQLVVHDLNSTNGVFLDYPGGDEFEVEPGEPALVEHGVQLSFGEFTVTVERS